MIYKLIIIGLGKITFMEWQVSLLCWTSILRALFTMASFLPAAVCSRFVVVRTVILIVLFSSLSPSLKPVLGTKSPPNIWLSNGCSSKKECVSRFHLFFLATIPGREVSRIMFSFKQCPVDLKLFRKANSIFYET